MNNPVIELIKQIFPDAILMEGIEIERRRLLPGVYKEPGDPLDESECFPRGSEFIDLELN